MKTETRLISVVLAVAALASVLAFGGVETLAFAPVQIVLAFVAILEFWRRGLPSVSRGTMLVLGTILTIPLLQLVPLASSLVAALSPARATLARDLFLSLAPITTALPITINSHETQLALLKLVCYVLVFLLGFQISRGRSGQTVLMTTLIGLGLFEAVYGIVQYLAGWQYIFTYAKKYYTEDATGTYINRNHFAGLLEMILPFVLASILLRRPAQVGNRRPRWVQVVASPTTFLSMRDVVLFTIICVGVIFSRSRMGIAAALVGVLLVLAIALLKSRRRSALAMALLVMALPAAYSLWIGLAPVLQRFEVLKQPKAFEQERAPIWRDTLALIRDYPLLGTGLGTYRWSSLHYQTHILDKYYEHAHGDYLEFAADIGVPTTMLLFGSLWVLVAKTARKALVLERREDTILAAGCAGAMAALLIHSITDFNLQIPANALIFSWIAGTATALSAEEHRLHQLKLPLRS